MEQEELTPERMEQLKAASTEREQRFMEITKERYQAAVEYLDDGKWTIDSKYTWKRSLDGQKLTFVVDKDRYNLTYPFKTQEKGYWGTGAFNFLFNIMHETEGGFEDNELKKIQRTRVPRKGAEVYAPRETLYLNKLDPEFLTAKEKLWNSNDVPPREVLVQMVKWDDYLQMLVKVNPERDTTEFVFDQNFVELNGQMYAIWRVRSMLEFGNQDGYASKERWAELLDKHPDIKTPLLPELPPPPDYLDIPDDQSAPHFKYKHNFSRRRMLTYELNRKQPQGDDPREPKTAKDKVHDARVLASQDQKTTLSTSKRIRRKAGNE